MSVWWSFRAEKLLEEYAEARLALMNRFAARSAEDRHSSASSSDDDDDGDDSGRSHCSRHPVNSHGYDSRNSSAVNSKTGRKSHTVRFNSSQHRENPASSRAPVRHSVWANSSSSTENPPPRKSRGSKVAAKQSECNRGRSPLGTINQQDNLYILGRHALPPLPAEHFLHHSGYSRN